MSPGKRPAMPGRGLVSFPYPLAFESEAENLSRRSHPSLNARCDPKSVESIISSAEISSNAEYNLRREQQHNHLPRPSRHHVKSYEPQKGTNPKNQY